MAVYLLLCVPLVYLIIVAVVADGEVWFVPGDYRYTFTPAFKGTLWFIPAIALILLWESALPLRYETGRIYLYHVGHEHGVPIIVGLLAALLSTRRLMRETDLRIHVAMTSILGGFFTAGALVDLLRESRFLDAYTLVLLPTLRAATMALVPLLVTAWRRESGGTRYLFAALIAVLPFVLSLPGFAHTLNYDLAAYIGTAAIVAAVSVAYTLIFRAVFPLRRSGAVSGGQSPMDEERSSDDDRSLGSSSSIGSDALRT